jgi:transposase
MRPPSVFVRTLAPVEGQRLKRLSKRAKHASTRQRAMILLASQTLMSPPEIARMLLSDESHVRKVIHDFNERGFDSLRPRFGGGRPRRISSDDEQRIVALAGARPDSLGVPFTRWSLAKLSRYLRGQGIAISPAQLGRVLKRAGVSFQRTRSWKQSPDPEYEAKAKRILALYRERPPNGVVISFDEKGPESLLPHAGTRLGAAWTARAAARDRQPPPRRPLPGRRSRRARRLPASEAQAPPGRRLDARLHEADPARLPAQAAPLLDPGQPLLPLDARDPRVGGREQRRARPQPPPTPASSTGSRVTSARSTSSFAPTPTTSTGTPSTTPWASTSVTATRPRLEPSARPKPRGDSGAELAVRPRQRSGSQPES